MEGVCVVIPALNVAATIGPLVCAIRTAGWPVCVVDDGSGDGSGVAAAAAGAHVITHPVNRGKGCALMSGFRYALDRGYGAVITMDGDGQHDPAELAAFVAAAEGADLVIGNRMHNASAMPFIRRLTNRMMSAILSRQCGLRIPDSQCGYRLIRCPWLQRLPLSSSRYDLESEILIRAARRGAVIVSVPIRVIYRDQRSHIRPCRDTLRFLHLLWRVRTEARPR